MHGSISKESTPKTSRKWNEKLDDGEISPDEKVIADVMPGTQNKNEEFLASNQKGTEVITPTVVNVSYTEPVIFASHGEEYQNALSKCKFYPMSNVKRSTVPDHMVSWKVISEVIFSCALLREDSQKILKDFCLNYLDTVSIVTGADH